MAHRKGGNRLAFFIVSFLASTAGAICGIGGGIAGRALNRRMDEKIVDKLFIGLMAVIIGISIYNGWQYSIQFWQAEH